MISAGDSYSMGKFILEDRSHMIRQSGLLEPTGEIALRTLCIRRSVLVNVPSFSANDAAGNTTCAYSAVSVRNMSDTARNSILLKTFLTSLISGWLMAGFAPITNMPEIPFPSSISILVSPGDVGTSVFHKFLNFFLISSSATS